MFGSKAGNPKFVLCQLGVFLFDPCRIAPRETISTHPDYYFKGVKFPRTKGSPRISQSGDSYYGHRRINSAQMCRRVEGGTACRNSPRPHMIHNLPAVTRHNHVASKCANSIHNPQKLSMRPRLRTNYCCANRA